MFDKVLNRSKLCALIHLKDLRLKCAMYNKSNTTHEPCIDPFKGITSMTFDFSGAGNEMNNDNFIKGKYCIYMNQIHVV